MPDYHLLPDNLVDSNFSTSLVCLAEYMIKSELHLVLPGVITYRTNEKKPNSPPRMDISINAITVRYDEGCPRSMKRHAKWVESTETGIDSKQLCVSLVQLAQNFLNMIQPIPKGQKMNAFFSILAVAPGAFDQEWHEDNRDFDGDYWTVIIPLTVIPGQGGTQFLTDGIPPFGLSYYFGGKVVHRGTANVSDEMRYALTLVLLSPAEDINRGTEVPIKLTKK
jgi:hypothetical protein